MREFLTTANIFSIPIQQEFKNNEKIALITHGLFCADIEPKGIYKKKKKKAIFLFQSEGVDFDLVP